MLQHMYHSLPVVTAHSLPSDTGATGCVPVVFSRLLPGFALFIYSTLYPVGGGIQDPSSVLCIKANVVKWVGVLCFCLLVWIFVSKSCSLYELEPMRHVKDHKEELSSCKSSHVGPAAPVTCVSGPFSSCQAVCNKLEL